MDRFPFCFLDSFLGFVPLEFATVLIGFIMIGFSGLLEILLMVLVFYGAEYHIIISIAFFVAIFFLGAIILIVFKLDDMRIMRVVYWVMFGALVFEFFLAISITILLPFGVLKNNPLAMLIIHFSWSFLMYYFFLTLRSYRHQELNELNA